MERNDESTVKKRNVCMLKKKIGCENAPFKILEILENFFGVRKINWPLRKIRTSLFVYLFFLIISLVY